MFTVSIRNYKSGHYCQFYDFWHKKLKDIAYLELKNCEKILGD